MSPTWDARADEHTNTRQIRTKNSIHLGFGRLVVRPLLVTFQFDFAGMRVHARPFERPARTVRACARAEEAAKHFRGGTADVVSS